MKKSLIATSGAALAAITMLFGGTAAAEVVYNNSTNDLQIRFNPGTTEVGDEIVLGGSSRTISTFVFEYWAVGLAGGETAQVRFYANNGPSVPAGPTILSPSSLLWDSGTFGIGNTAGNTLSFDQAALGGGVHVPDSFTWTVQFNGTDGAGESAGVVLFNPPTVGSSYLEYWENVGGSDWQYRTISNDSTNVPANFAAYVEAVPEPSTIMLGLLGGLGLLGWRYRRGGVKS